MSKSRTFIPVLGTRYGTRVIVEDIEQPSPNGKRLVKVRCDCGVEGLVQFTLLRQGRSKTCATCSSSAAGVRAAKRWRSRLSQKVALGRAGHKAKG